MQKTFRGATLARGACALAGFSANATTASETISFTWHAASLDTDSSAWNQAGCIDNGAETQLSVNGPAFAPSSASVSLVVHGGDTFGFYVHSTDSTGGAAMLAVIQDLAPPPPPASPEPQAPALMLAGRAALFAAARRGSSKGA